MEIKGKVHCFFEQSGTFKNEFIKLGIPAEDYDIQNNFGETDHVVDLFKAIEDAYEGQPSLFDHVKGEDLIVAFFPCIYFSCLSQMAMRLSNKNYKKLSDAQKIAEIIKRSSLRELFYQRLLKFVAVCYDRGIRMVFENPWTTDTFLKANFLKNPDVVDNNRLLRGDYFVKPTAYWFFNCNPTYGFTEQHDKKKKELMWCRQAPEAGMCSEERSMISPDYARNFICDFILGKEQLGTQLSMF
jgi:hypothetical protein